MDLYKIKCISALTCGQDTKQSCLWIETEFCCLYEWITCYSTTTLSLTIKVGGLFPEDITFMHAIYCTFINQKTNSTSLSNDQMSC